MEQNVNVTSRVCFNFGHIQTLGMYTRPSNPRRLVLRPRLAKTQASENARVPPTAKMYILHGPKAPQRCKIHEEREIQSCRAVQCTYTCVEKMPASHTSAHIAQHSRRRFCTKSHWTHFGAIHRPNGTRHGKTFLIPIVEAVMGFRYR